MFKQNKQKIKASLIEKMNRKIMIVELILLLILI